MNTAMTTLNESDLFQNGTISNSTDWDIGGVFKNPFDILRVRVIFTVCFATVFSLCIIGNSMVLFAIARSPRLRSMTNFLLANLAIADFCVGAFCVLPNLSILLQPNWVLGKAMCKIYYYIRNVSYIASIIILTVIAIERYIAIIHPMKARHFMTNRRLVLVQIMTWLISLIYNIPFLIFYDTISFSETGKEYCYTSYQHIDSLKWLSLFNLIIWYAFPLLLIGFMYYKVARTLWKTAVVSALRLQPYPDNDDVSSQRASTRTTNQSFRNTLEKNASLSPNLSEERADNPPGQSSSSSESQYSDKALFTSKGKHAFTLVCGIRQGDITSPNEIKCFFPNSTDVTESDMAVQFCGSQENETISFIGRRSLRQSSFRQNRYRLTYLSSSRRVAKARRKVIRLLISVVVTFGICVLPHMMKVLNHYWTIFHFPHSVGTILSPVSSLVLYLNSVLNPFLYAIFSTNFRRSFKESLSCFRKRKKNNIKS